MMHDLYHGFLDSPPDRERVAAAWPPFSIRGKVPNTMRRRSRRSDA
ncbi:hypothetical protein ACU686_26815 [Yinghuangia aomiensis]